MGKSPSNFIDITGEEYENFKVLRKGSGRYTSGGQYKATWICLCKCGKEFEADSALIRSGRTKSCGCMNFKDRSKMSEDLSGRKFGRLTVVRRLKPEEVETVQYNWLCQCECGNYVKASANKLKTGHTKSCGCLKREFSIGDKTRTHGLRKSTRLYHIYATMKQRCNNPNNSQYKNYGGRGIRVCDEWNHKNGFESFYKWAIGAGFDESKTWQEQSIDRIDVNGNYEPSNCRWVTNLEQQRNKRTSK